MVLVFLATRVLHLFQFHIPSHGPIQKLKKKTGTDHDTLKHGQIFDPKILWDTLDDLTKYEGYPNNE